jgi:hypothetical protein
MHRFNLSVLAAGTLLISITVTAQAQEANTGAAEDTAEGMRSMEEVIVTGTAVQERTRFDSSVAISTF